LLDNIAHFPSSCILQSCFEISVHIHPSDKNQERARQETQKSIGNTGLAAVGNVKTNTPFSEKYE